MKKTIKIILWVVGIVTAVLLVVSVAAGPIAKGYLNHHSQKLIGQRAEVGHVGLNLFTGRLKVHDLEVYEDDSQTLYAGFDTLDLRLHLLQLPFRTVNLRHLTLSGLHANILQDGERFNFSSIIDHFASDDDDKDTTPSRWTFKFYNIHLAHANLRYSDLRGNKELSLPDVNLRVPGFVLGGDEATEGGLNINFDKGGHLNADANYDASTKQYRATVDLTGFSLHNIEGYVQDYITLERMDGNLDVHLTANGSHTELLKSHIGATLSLSNVDLRDSQSQLAGLTALNVKVNNINIDQNSFDIAEVHLDGLTAQYEQWDGYTNISRLIKKSETFDTSANAESDESSEKSEKKPMQLHVGSLLVENCALTYTDNTLPDKFSFPMTNIKVTAKDLSFGGDNNAQLRATLPGGGYLVARWQGNLDHWKQHQDLFLTIKGLDLKQLSPLTVAYTGQPVEDGIFGLTSHNTIQNSLLNGQNIIDIYNPVVGKKRKDVDAQKSLPLKTALYVLKDKNNKIQLDVPVKGNIDNPEFNYMKLLWKTLGNLIVKVATSPARALGNALGMDEADLEFIAIDPTQHSLTSEQYHTLGQLASIVTSDSLIHLQLELRMPEATSDKENRSYGRLNELVRQYLMDQGVNESQIDVTTGTPTSSNKERTGYAVSSEIIIDE